MYIFQKLDVDDKQFDEDEDVKQPLPDEKREGKNSYLKLKPVIKYNILKLTKWCYP